MMKILIDCHGGDNSPHANVTGALNALRTLADSEPDLRIVLVGNEDEILPLSEPYRDLSDRFEIVHAPGIITGEDKPTDAIRLKKDSSMIRAINMLREDEEAKAIISAGSTGALVAAATLRIGRIRGIKRPAFCPVFATMAGTVVGICDSGANVDISPDMLLQYAVMGSCYMESAYGIESPRVALLNIGTETEKGDDLRKEAFPKLSSLGCINFVGNMESRDLLTGRYDLVVCDGFSGNVLIKTTEGTALQLLKRLKTDIMKKKKYMFGALFMKQLFAEEKKLLDYQNYGGSALLGTSKIVIKGHGSSNATAIAKSVETAVKLEKNDMIGKIKAALAGLPDGGED